MQMPQESWLWKDHSSFGVQKALELSRAEARKPGKSKPHLSLQVDFAVQGPNSTLRQPQGHELGHASLPLSLPSSCPYVAPISSP